LTQSGDDQLALPGAIQIVAEMLDGATTADSEVRADRFDPLWARLLDIHKLSAVGVARHGIYFDRLSWKGSGDVNRSVGTVAYSVAVLTEPLDLNALSHAWPR
jgi:hypothetical protein